MTEIASVIKDLKACGQWCMGESLDNIFRLNRQATK